MQFTITDAQSILIRYLPKGWGDLSDPHSQCKNFQFGYQTFEVNQVGDSAPREVITKLRDRKPLRRENCSSMQDNRIFK